MAARPEDPAQSGAGKDVDHRPAASRIDRRAFLKLVGVAGVAASGLDRVRAEEAGEDREPYGILIDTTRCAGCRNCEIVCAEEHGLPEPDLSDDVLDEERTTSETQWAIVNRYETERGEVFVKRQCMHCVQPACATACLTKAMLKTAEGPVFWRENKCMGCRFCMLSCPFDMPKFEYHSALPRIRKCNMCLDRVDRGLLPACVENCPAEALVFGRRSELIAEARRRIHEDPDGYVPEIYGEHEVGGTCVLYLASVPFDQIGLKTDLGTTPYPELTRGFLYVVPIVLTLLPAFLLAVSKSRQREQGESERDGGFDELSDARTIARL